MKTKIFIDGSEGTTGLRIHERFAGRDDVEILPIASELRKDAGERKRLINESDITFLCLPDVAARESVSLIENENVRIIDTSTAHRTEEGWAYGFPELSGEFRDKISKGKRIAVPGCYATGFISLVYPLIQSGIMPRDYPVATFAMSGYSGAGRKAIAVYESKDRAPEFDAPREYALSQQHKHLKEMLTFAGLVSPPVFSPIVDDFYSGMLVTVPFFGRAVKGGIEAVKACLKAKYEDGGIIKYKECDRPTLFAGSLTGKDSMVITVSGNEERFTVSALYDNLGKGASGAAMQCMNIMLGTDEKLGLCL